MKTIAYLGTAAKGQDLERLKSKVVQYSNQYSLGQVSFIEEDMINKVSWQKRKIAHIIKDLGDGDNLIVPELSRLGRSLLEILDILKNAKEKGINIYDIKDAWTLNGIMQPEAYGYVFDMISELERELISQRTREALRIRKDKGVKLGRPKGPGKSKLDHYRTEILEYLSHGSTRKWVAKRYGCTEQTLHNWINKNRITIAKEESRAI